MRTHPSGGGMHGPVRCSAEQPDHATHVPAFDGDRRRGGRARRCAGGDLDRGPGAGGTVVGRPAADRGGAGHPHIHEWAGFEAQWFWRDYAKQGYPDPKFSFLTNTEGVIAKTQAGFEWDITHPEVGYIQDYLNMGVLQPWDTC